MEEGDSWANAYELLLEAENSPQLTASKEMETSILQLWGTEFC